MEPFAIERLGPSEFADRHQGSGENAGRLGANGRVFCGPKGAREGVGAVENGKGFGVVIFAGVLTADREQELDVIAGVRVPLTVDEVLFAIEQLIDCERFADRRGVAEQKFREVLAFFDWSKVPAAPAAMAANASVVSVTAVRLRRMNFPVLYITVSGRAPMGSQ
jgi:hypothetical protein